MAHTRGLRCEQVGPRPPDLRSGPGIGRGLLLLTSVGGNAAGLTIMTAGMTRVFAPQDLEVMGITREAISGINPHLVPLIAHDRAGFGGALVSFGIAMFACIRYGRASRAPWQVLTIAGGAGFATAIGVHPAIGYLSFGHLRPAVFGCLVLAVGVTLARREEHGWSFRILFLGLRSVKRNLT